MIAKKINQDEAKTEIDNLVTDIILMVTQNLEDIKDTEKNIGFDVVFTRKDKSIAYNIIASAKAIFLSYEDFVKKIVCYTEKQEINDIKPVGLRTIFLVGK